MLGPRELGIDDPVAERKRLVTYVEIDRCVTDGRSRSWPIAAWASAHWKFSRLGQSRRYFRGSQDGDERSASPRENPPSQAARDMFPGN